jgi:hypothetical protein
LDKTVAEDESPKFTLWLSKNPMGRRRRGRSLARDTNPSPHVTGLSLAERKAKVRGTQGCVTSGADEVVMRQSAGWVFAMPMDAGHLRENPHSRPLRVLEWGTLKAILSKQIGYLGHPPAAAAGHP